jgi:hypothetical protein
MFLSLDWHPFEIRRRLELFSKSLRDDFDFCYPEVRQRQALEIAPLLEEIPSKLSTDFLKELNLSVKRISIFDWKQLFEWNERCQTIKVLFSLDRILKRPVSEETTERLVEKIRERSRQIAKMIESKSLSSDPSIFELISYRWQIASLRDEADYLISRWPS